MSEKKNTVYDHRGGKAKMTQSNDPQHKIKDVKYSWSEARGQISWTHIQKNKDKIKKLKVHYSEKKKQFDLSGLIKVRKLKFSIWKQINGALFLSFPFPFHKKKLKQHLQNVSIFLPVFRHVLSKLLRYTRTEKIYAFNYEWKPNEKRCIYYYKQCPGQFRVLLRCILSDMRRLKAGTLRLSLDRIAG